MKIAICIVLYNCSLKESTAVQSLVSLKGNLKDIDITLYLNGDCGLDDPLHLYLFNIKDNYGKNLFLLKN